METLPLTVHDAIFGVLDTSRDTMSSYGIWKVLSTSDCDMRINNSANSLLVGTLDGRVGANALRSA
jgi:hypothetical protein